VQDNRIDALVALDGSMRYYPGLVKQGDVHPEHMAIPLLFFAQGGVTLEDQERYLNSEKSQGPSVLNAWTHGDLVLVRMLGLVHVEHSSMYQRNEDVWKRFADEKIADYDRADKYLHGLAEKTGGRLYQANDSAQLEQAFSRIAEELRRQYSLGYYPQNNPQASGGTSGERRQIKVRVHQPNLAVRARDSYVRSPSASN